jgi:3'-5' exoribonuclease
MKLRVATIANMKLRVIVVETIKELGKNFTRKPQEFPCTMRIRTEGCHTVHTVRAGKSLLPLYPFVDSDIAMADLLLHDIGKVSEYMRDVVPQRTKGRVLQGHLVLGYRLIRKIAIQHQLDGEILERLGHILLSHHNDLEFGAVVRPVTPEAVFISLVDNRDAKIGMVEQLLRSTPGKNVFSEFHKALEGKLLILPIDVPNDSEFN